MGRRRRNPRWPWILAGSAAAAAVLGGAGYVYWRRRSEKRLCPAGTHVGTVGYAWPYPDLFLDVSGFGEALETFGYNVGDWADPDWNVCSVAVRNAVEAFQRDYNLVWQTIDDPVTDPLATTGLIDDETVKAMAYVDGLLQMDFTWPLLVEETKEAGTT